MWVLGFFYFDTDSVIQYSDEEEKNLCHMQYGVFNLIHLKMGLLTFTSFKPTVNEDFCGFFS